MDPTIFFKCITFLFTLVNVFLFSTGSYRIEPAPDSYFDANIALKRRQTSGLIPFPRVGRSNSFRFLEQIKRREGLIPFPRVGKRREEEANELSVSWFGPRLGRDNHR